jgi:signal transduction histidine kinase
MANQLLISVVDDDESKSSGTGMGLSICRSIIHGHGGKLWAEANEPRGAVFQFTLHGTDGEFTSPPQVGHRTSELRKRIG